MQEIVDLASKAVEKVSSGEHPTLAAAVSSMASDGAWPFEKVARVCQAANNALLREKKSGSDPYWSIRFETAKPGSLAEDARSTVMKKASAAVLSKVSSVSEGRNMVPALSNPPKYDAAPEGCGIDFYFQETTEKVSSPAEAEESLGHLLLEARGMLREVEREIENAEFMREQHAATLQVHMGRVAKASSAYVAMSAVLQAADELGSKFPDCSDYAEAAVAHYAELSDESPDAILLGAQKTSAAGSRRSVLDVNSPMVKASLRYFEACDKHSGLLSVREDLRQQIGAGEDELAEG